MMEGKPVRTAEANCSIWKDLSEDAFRRPIIRLHHATEGVPVEPTHWWTITESRTGPTDAIDGQIRSVSYQTEQRLADDVAFISAAQEGAESVSAACIEELHEPPGLIFRIAANEGIREEIRSALRAICDCLMSCATKDMSLAECISKIRRLILALSRPRIVSRMRLFLGYPPSHQHGADTVRDGVLRRTLTRMRQSASARAGAELVDRISQLEAKFQNALNSPDSRLMHELEECVRECCSITTSDGRNSFRSTLQEAGLSVDLWFKNKFNMQVDKLGAYHRIPETMAKQSRRRGTRELFSSIKLEYIDPYQPVKSSISLDGKKVFCYVHAEVQMVIHYLLNRTSTPPRVIGTSKEACFLCSRFIAEHREFSVSASHGRLYEKWTIPDLGDFSAEDVTIVKAIIHRMYRQCNQLISTAPRWLPYPLTSRQNLPELPVFSPASTVQSMQLGPPRGSGITVSTVAERLEPCSRAESSTMIPTRGPVPEPVISEPPSNVDDAPTPRQINHTVETGVTVENITTRLASHSLSDRDGRTSSASSLSSARNLLLHPDTPQVINLPNITMTAEIQAPSVGLLTLRDHNPVKTDPGSWTVNLEDLKEGDETSFQKRESDTSIELHFQRCGAIVCSVALKWM